MASRIGGGSWGLLIALTVLAVVLARETVRDERRAAEWARRDAALHDSLMVTERAIRAATARADSLEARVAAVRAADRAASRQASVAMDSLEALRQAADSAVRDASVSRDSLGALLRAMSARILRAEQTAIEARSAAEARAAADSGIIASWRAVVRSDSTALQQAHRQLAVKDQRIAVLEGRRRPLARVLDGLASFGVGGTCGAVGWAVGGPLTGIAAGAVCVGGLAILRP